MADETALDFTGTLVPALRQSPSEMSALDEAVKRWLEAKAKHSGSARTLATYSETMSRFRLRLRAMGTDLDEPDEEVIARAAEDFADERSVRGRSAGKPVANGTYNQRLAVISSFYEYARRRRMLNRPNPLETVDRRKDEAYESAAPLDARVIVQKLAAIDRDTLQGTRDYVLLSIGLMTGRRMTELATMTWGSIQIAGGVVTLVFKAKGAKTMRDELSRPVGEALMTWVYRWYGGVNIPPESPLWVSLEANTRGHRLSHQAIAYICRKRLGTSKVHAMRHTFAHGMESVGASVSEIQARLGHSNLATTGRYLAKLRSAKNMHADELAALFGIK